MPSTANPSLFVRLIYGCYAWFILIFCVLPVAAALLLLPGLKRRRTVARWGATTVFKLIGSEIEILGDPVTDADIAVVVANHQSYLDGIILTAALPPHYTFLIKGEMVKVPVAGFVLSRLGSLFVDRSDPNQRHRSGRRLVEAAQQGQAIAVFPEGTFDEEPGLKPFHLGAFRAAWRAKLPVQPVVITGARWMLPSGSWLPRPGPLTVEFRPMLNADDFSSLQGLVQATRRAILERLPEPDLEAEEHQRSA